MAKHRNQNAQWTKCAVRTVATASVLGGFALAIPGAANADDVDPFVPGAPAPAPEPVVVDPAAPLPVDPAAPLPVDPAAPVPVDPAAPVPLDPAALLPVVTEVLPIADYHVIAAQAAQSVQGAPYSYGAAGPDAFDCSGLVYWAYQAAGITIPRDSYGQLGAGTPVDLNALVPGDVIIYNGGGHAAIYVGDGQVVHSLNYGYPVSAMDLHGMDIYGARRY